MDNVHISICMYIDIDMNTDLDMDIHNDIDTEIDSPRISPESTRRVQSLAWPQPSSYTSPWPFL